MNGFIKNTQALIAILGATLAAAAFEAGMMDSKIATVIKYVDTRQSDVKESISELKEMQKETQRMVFELYKRGR